MSQSSTTPPLSTMEKYLKSIELIDLLRSDIDSLERISRGAISEAAKLNLKGIFARFIKGMKDAAPDDIVKEAVKSMQNSMTKINETPNDDKGGYVTIARELGNIQYQCGFVKGLLFVNYHRFMVEEEMSRKLRTQLNLGPREDEE